MVRIAAFTLLVTVMTAAALFLADGPSNRAQAGDSTAPCRTVTVQPDSGYGLAQPTKIVECR